MCENCERFGLLVFEGEIKELALNLLVEPDKTSKHTVAVNIHSKYQVFYCYSCGTLTIKEVKNIKENKRIETHIAGYPVKILVKP